MVNLLVRIIIKKEKKRDDLNYHGPSSPSDTSDGGGLI